MSADPPNTLTPSSLEAAMLRVRTGARQFITNLFVSPSQYDAWIRRGLRLLSNRERFLLLGRGEPQCERLFFAGSELELSPALAELPNTGIVPRVVDLVRRPPMMMSVMETLAAAGFRPYSRLVRLSRLGSHVFSGQHSGRGFCARARPGDISLIQAILRDQFDPFTDQFPGDQEMGEAIAAGEVRVARVDESGLAGFLWFERTGVTAHMRYWGVAPSMQARGMGGLLMRDYFHRTSDCNRHLLWVRENNSAARRCYEHYGYQPDGLEDQILLKDT